MRVTSIAALAALFLFGGMAGAMACEPITVGCLPSVVVWPVQSQTGSDLGSVEARVQRVPHLEASRFTGQPVTVLYDNPGSLPGSVDPDLRLVPLPDVKRGDTIGAYPVGY